MMSDKLIPPLPRESADDSALSHRKQSTAIKATRHGSQVNDDFGLTRRCDSLGAPNHLGRRMDKTSDFLADED
ncbi:MAG: hypothetical protein WAV18_11570, partial [Roseiarcus sp.]